MSEEGSLKHDSRTQPQPNVRLWTAGKCEKTKNNNSERRSRSPIGVRPLSHADDGEFESQNSRYPSPASRSKITSQSAHHHGRIPTTPSFTRDFAEQADLSSHQSSVHASPEVCDPNIASIIYSTPSNEKRTTPRKRKIPKLGFFPCFGRRKRKPECWMEDKRRSFWSWETQEQARLREEKDWKRVKEGRNGKSSLERQLEWQNGLRAYEDCSIWQRYVGQDTRQRHQTKLIKAAVREKPISDIQELRSDAIMMENELFGTSEDLDEYKNKTRKIVKALDEKRQLQREKEILQNDNPKKNNWQVLALSLVKLKEFLPTKTSSLTQLWGGQDSPRSSIESVEAIPCNCREHEVISICPLEDERMKSGQENPCIQNEVTLDRQNEVTVHKQNEITLNRPNKMRYKPNLKRIKRGYRDKKCAVGWNYRPPENPEASWHDDDQETTSPLHHRCDLNSSNANKFHWCSTKAQIKADGELDDDEWSIIDRESSPTLPNCFKCFH